LILVSGGAGTDPRTPAGPAGMPPPFLGTAVVGDGGLTAAIDAYGDVVDMRAPGPAGEALIDNPADRQAAGSVPADTGIVPRVRIDGGPALALWRADSVFQRYLPGTNVVRTVARFGGVRVVVTAAAGSGMLGQVMEVSAPAGVRVAAVLGVNVATGGCETEQRPRRIDLICAPRAAVVPPSRGVGSLRVSDPSESIGGHAVAIIRLAAAGDRAWLGGAKPLGAGAPPWARRMYRRSLLTLRALTDSRTGAAAAGARDGWAYVWPRDAATAALAFAAAGYRAEARRVAGFLLGLDLGAAARFHGDGSPVEGRAAQGDAAGWTAVAVLRTGLARRHQWTAGRNRDARLDRTAWRFRADYQEGEPGDYLGNAIATSAVGAAGTDVSEETRAYSPRNSDTSAGEGSRAVARKEASRAGSVRRGASRAVALRIGGDFSADGGLARRHGDSQSGLDSAAAWAVRPFSLPGLYPEVRRTLRRLVAEGTRFGITPGEAWRGADPWTAPTAWTAWSLAALAGSDKRMHHFPVPAAGGDRHPRHNVAPAKHHEPLRSPALPGLTLREEAMRRKAMAGQAPRGQFLRREALRRQALRLLGDLRRAATPAGALPERVDARTGVPRSTTPLAWSHAFAILALRELWPGR
jgi:hypothetical protein